MVSKIGHNHCTVKPQKAPEEGVWVSSERLACACQRVKSQSKPSEGKVSVKTVQFLSLQKGELDSLVFITELQLR